MSALPFAEVRAWMFEAALPFWADAGLDREYGGFLEELDFSGKPTDCPFKRVRVTCRQIYVYAHAAMLGWEDGDRIAKLAYDYLIEKAWQGPDKGWARRLTREGAVLDATPDLYDTAFALFALSWRYRQSRDPDALARMHATLDFVETHMRPADGEGYWHALPPAGPRVQNPHMHLLEASLAAFEASQDQRFLDQARKLVALFRARFFDGTTLGEFFDADWRRLPNEQGRIVEPGHQFEWAWILAQYARLTGEDTRAEALALVDFSERFGVDASTRLVYNSVRDDGAPLDRNSRSWTITERLKAHLALFELTGRDPGAPALEATRVLFDRYLAVSPRGMWIDQFDAEGRPAAKAVPTSILYHMFLAFAELLRLEPALSKR